MALKRIDKELFNTICAEDGCKLRDTVQEFFKKQGIDFIRSLENREATSPIVYIHNPSPGFDLAKFDFQARDVTVEGFEFDANKYIVFIDEKVLNNDEIIQAVQRVHADYVKDVVVVLEEKVDLSGFDADTKADVKSLLESK